MVFRKDELVSLELRLRTLVQQLLAEIRSSDTKSIHITMQTMVDIFGELEKSFHKGNSKSKNEVLQLLMQLIKTFQENIKDARQRATLSSILVHLQWLQQTQTADAQSVAAIFKSSQQSMNMVSKAFQSGSSTDGMISDQDALKSVFINFQMITSYIQNGNMKQVGDLLQQLEIMLQGMLLHTTNKSTLNMLQSLSINLNMHLQSASTKYLSASDVTTLIGQMSNVLNQTFDLKGISEAAHFISKTGGNTSEYPQQISVVYKNIQNSLSTKDFDSVQTLILQLMKILIELLSHVSGIDKMDVVSKAIIELNTVHEQITTKSISSNQIQTIISQYMKNLNQVIDMTSVIGDETINEGSTSTTTTTTETCTKSGELFAYPDDCTKYYICDHNRKVERPCGPGTNWNDRQKVCDWPQNAGCKVTANARKKISGSTHKSLKATADNHE